MTTRTATIVILVLFAVALGGSLALYPWLPPRLPVHWNIRGEVDSWGNKTTAILLISSVTLVLLFFTVACDWLSPRHFKVREFRHAVNYLMVTCAALIMFLQAIMLLNGLNPDRQYGRVMISGLFLFFAWMGNWLGKTRRNFWIGIRTPWTLASDTVWIATHRLGARIFVTVGLLGAIGVALGVPTSWCLVLLIAGMCAPVTYSFWLSKKLEKTHEPEELG